MVGEVGADGGREGLSTHQYLFVTIWSIMFSYDKQTKSLHVSMGKVSFCGYRYTCSNI